MVGFPVEVFTTLQDEELVGPTGKGKCSWQREGQVDWRQEGVGGGGVGGDSVSRTQQRASLTRLEIGAPGCLTPSSPVRETESRAAPTKGSSSCFIKTFL